MFQRRKTSSPAKVSNNILSATEPRASPETVIVTEQQFTEETRRHECPVCGSSEYAEPDLPHHLGIHPPTKVVASAIGEDAWIFRREDGRETGPFGPREMADLGFESLVAH